jgi:hypothetical protein
MTHREAESLVDRFGPEQRDLAQVVKFLGV